MICLTEEKVKKLKKEIKRLVDFVFEHIEDYDTSHSLMYSGRKYCTSCGVFEENGVIEHKSDCIFHLVTEIDTTIKRSEAFDRNMEEFSEI